jgi:hypothetical protein
LLSRTDCVGPHALDISVVYEFYSILNCSQLCCIVEENASAILLVWHWHALKLSMRVWCVTKQMCV